MISESLNNDIPSGKRRRDSRIGVTSEDQQGKQHELDDIEVESSVGQDEFRSTTLDVLKELESTNIPSFSFCSCCTDELVL